MPLGRRLAGYRNIREDYLLACHKAQAFISRVLGGLTMAAMGLFLSAQTPAAAPAGAAPAAEAPFKVRQDGACTDSNGRPEIQVDISDIRDGGGNLRLNVYDNKPGEFLKKGKWIVRVDMPIRPGSMEVCVWVPSPGTYGLVIMHDRNANGRYNLLRDGYGVSTNPRLRLRKPKYEEAAFIVGAERTELAVMMKYRFGNKKKKRAAATP